MAVTVSLPMAVAVTVTATMSFENTNHYSVLELLVSSDHTHHDPRSSRQIDDRLEILNLPAFVLRCDTTLA